MWDEPAADDYERGRPDYAPSALAWLVQKGALGPARRVVDVGAGTGKLTRPLMLTRARVVAVEPLPAMRSRLPRRVAVAGLAEALPVRSGWADLVTAGQAFHWFSPAAAAREAHRVLKPRGRLALLRNDTAKEGDWPDLDERLAERLAALGAAERTEGGANGWRSEIEATGLFSPLEDRSFRHQIETDVESLVALICSYSRVARLTAERRSEIRREIGEVIAAHPAVGGRPRFAMPLTTELTTCVASGASGAGR